MENASVLNIEIIKVTFMLLALDKFSLSEKFFGFFLIHFLFINPVMSRAVFATI